MKIIFLFFLYASILYGTILDDYHLYQAGESLKEQKYENAILHYEKIENKTAEVYYNLGNLYYLQGKYQKAIKFYLLVKKQSLEFKKLHNLGNCYVKLHQLNKAVMNYKKALLVQQDDTTRKNLLIVEQEQAKLLKKNVAKNKKSKKGNRFEGKSDFEDDTVSKEGKYSKNNTNKLSQNERIIQNSIQQEQKISPKSTNQEMTLKWKKNDLIKLNNEIIVRKWEKIIENRKLNTLLIPLNDEGEGYEKIDTPW